MGDTETKPAFPKEVGALGTARMSSAPHLLSHLRGSADFYDITGTRRPGGGWFHVQGQAGGWTGPCCYLHVERLPGWPLSFGFDDSEDLIAL